MIFYSRVSPRYAKMVLDTNRSSYEFIYDHAVLHMSSVYDLNGRDLPVSVFNPRKKIFI